MKRILALLLCLATVLVLFAGCSHGENDRGAYIRMYLTEPVYDLDPIKATDSVAAMQLAGLLFEGLFEADDDGKPQKALVDKYEYNADKKAARYALTLKLKETTWSDGVKISANDVQFAFRRVFESTYNVPVLSQLLVIKNARAISAGDDSIDHLAVVVVDSTTVEIQFESDIDVDTFLTALCSPALYPLRDDIVSVNADWAKKKSSAFVCSGPFMVRSMDFEEKDGFVLERNSYYYRDRQKDKIDKYVTPFRLIVDYVTDPAEQLKLFNSKDAGALYYAGHVPLAARTDDAYAAILKKLKVTDAPATTTLFLNENAEIDGKTLFADAAVRRALSLAVDRDALAETLVYAKAADGLVPWTVLNRTDKKTEFRKKADSYIASAADVEAAKALLKDAGVTPSAYTFSIIVADYNEDHVAIAQAVAAAWKSLGFKVTVDAKKAYMRTETTVYAATVLDDDAIAEVTAALYALDPSVRNVSVSFTKEGASALDYTTNFTVTAGKQVKKLAVEGAVTGLGHQLGSKATEVNETGIYEDPYREALQNGAYTVILRDLVAASPDAFSVLAPFATVYAGNGYRAVTDAEGKITYTRNPHETGYASDAYNAKIDEAAAATKQKTRAKLLHEAEALLMEDMPVIPLVYNQKTVLRSSKLSKVEQNFFYTDFTKTKLSGYWKIALREGFVETESK